jgi:hypothetical protein
LATEIGRRRVYRAKAEVIWQTDDGFVDAQLNESLTKACGSGHVEDHVNDRFLRLDHGHIPELVGGIRTWLGKTFLTMPPTTV